MEWRLLTLFPSHFEVMLWETESASPFPSKQKAGYMHGICVWRGTWGIARGLVPACPKIKEELPRPLERPALPQLLALSSSQDGKKQNSGWKTPLVQARRVPRAPAGQQSVSSTASSPPLLGFPPQGSEDIQPAALTSGRWHPALQSSPCWLPRCELLPVCPRGSCSAQVVGWLHTLHTGQGAERRGLWEAGGSARASEILGDSCVLTLTRVSPYYA